jgi:selenide,water dikinase
LLNKIGTELAQKAAVHAVTDVTGFGLLGHSLEMARGSDVEVVLNVDRLPLLKEAERFAGQGFVTGASGRNWASYSDGVILPADLPDWRRSVLTDPQTSGGLLIACDPAAADSVLGEITAAGCPHAAIIGRVESGKASVRVEI